MSRSKSKIFSASNGGGLLHGESWGETKSQEYELLRDLRLFYLVLKFKGSKMLKQVLPGSEETVISPWCFWMML